MNCDYCGAKLDPSKRACPSCLEDCGFPNVRLAQSEAETAALNARVYDADVSADARQCKAELDDFADAVTKSSEATIARPLRVIHNLISEPLYSYISFKKEIDAEQRTAQDNEWDAVRTQYEHALYPNFHEKIIFSSLSLNNKGLSGYGAVVIVLKEALIRKRTSLFEENPHSFIQKHKVLLNEKIPSGFRSDWDNRGNLARAKLHSKITPSISPSEYGEILITDNGGTGDGDWIEAHIYGSINRSAIKTLIRNQDFNRANSYIWRGLVELATEVGVEALDA